MGQYHVTGSPCPTCRMVNDGATTAIGEEGAPQEGDVTLCIGCGEILIFNVIGATSKISKETFESFPEEQRSSIVLLQKAIRNKRRTKP